MMIDLMMLRRSIRNDKSNQMVNLDNETRDYETMKNWTGY